MFPTFLCLHFYKNIRTYCWIYMLYLFFFLVHSSCCSSIHFSFIYLDFFILYFPFSYRYVFIIVSSETRRHHYTECILSNSRQCVNIRIINQQEKPLTKNIYSRPPPLFRNDNYSYKSESQQLLRGKNNKKIV